MENDKQPVFQGMSQYRAPLNFELAGKQYKLILDNGKTVTINFGADTLLWSELGGAPTSEYYECAKIDEQTYFVNFEFAHVKPRTNIVLVVDIEQGLVTQITSRTEFNLQHPALCENDYVFGAIALPGKPVNEKRHSRTKDLVSKRIHWHYSPKLEIVHVYYCTDYIRVTFPEGKVWGDVPPQEFLDALEQYPYDEKAFYIKIKENIYLIAVAEQNMAKRGLSGNSLVFLIDAKRVHDLGRSFGHTGKGPNFEPENYIFGAYGDFVYSDGIIEARKNKYIT
jgi:hypothetical protein